MLLDQACIYDFLFMDIELGSENEIDLGLKIRKKHKNCHIIITSNYTKYLIDGYKVKADRYLLKPISQELFDSEMAPVFREYYAENTTIYDEKISRYRIRLNDIMYIDFFDKNSYLVFDNGKKLKTPYPLYYWEEELLGRKIIQRIFCEMLQKYIGEFKLCRYNRKKRYYFSE